MRVESGEWRVGNGEFRLPHSALLTTADTLGRPKNSALFDTAAQPVTIIRALGFSLPNLFTNRLASRYAVSVTVQVFTMIVEGVSASSTSLNPFVAKCSLITCVSYWFTLQPNVMNEHLLLSLAIIRRVYSNKSVSVLQGVFPLVISKSPAAGRTSNEGTRHPLLPLS